MVRCVVGSILHSGPIELFFVPDSAPRLVYQRPWYVLSCLWDGAYKKTLLLIGKSSPCDGYIFMYLVIIIIIIIVIIIIFIWLNSHLVALMVRMAVTI